MKLFFCASCQDVLRIFPTDWRRCTCGKSAGRYAPDGVEGLFVGEAVPLGFVNDAFVAALRNRPESGKGERFTAFVIPKSAPRVKVLSGWGPR